MKNLFHQIYTIGITVFFTLLFGLLTIILGGAEAILLGKNPAKGKPVVLGRFFRKAWAYSILLFHAVRIRRVESQPIDQNRGHIVVANHQSALDILVAAAALPDNLVFFAKKELSKVPILGWASWLAGSVYIDRKKGMQDASAIQAVREAVQNKNLIIIFPEGTRSEDGHLLPFKRGAFVLAIESQSPIYVLTICDSSRLLPKASTRISSGELGLYFGPVIETNNFKVEDRFELAEKVRGIMLKNLDQWTQRENNRAGHVKA